MLITNKQLHFSSVSNFSIFLITLPFGHAMFLHLYHLTYIGDHLEINVVGSNFRPLLPNSPKITSDETDDTIFSF